MLVALIGLLVWTDVETTDELRGFTDNTANVTALVEARQIVQDERHELLRPDPIEATRPLFLDWRGGPDSFEGSFPTRAQQVLGDANLSIDPNAQVTIARALHASGQSIEAADRYTAIVEAIDRAISRELLDSPIGDIDRRSDALLALMVANEAMLLEDLEIRLGEADPLTVARLHAVELSSLDRFARDASPAGHTTLETLTLTPEWGDSAVLRSQLLDPTVGEFNEGEWAFSTTLRVNAMTQLVSSEATALGSATDSLAARGIDRLVWLGTIVASVLIIGSLATFAIRRSIVQPLQHIGQAAKRLSRGAPADIDDHSPDEIGTVSESISSLHDTMHALWTDIDEISKSMAEGDFQKRLDTTGLEGDWLQLAETMNATLATGEAHNTSVEAELIRRDVLTEIAGAALLAENATELTDVVLHNLPGAVPGSRAHLHQHPSGPPLYHLGVELEPTISALELPTIADHAQHVQLRDGHGVASLVEFGQGPPAVLVLAFGNHEPEDLGPLIGLVETASRVLAQAHRRQAAEWSATHHFEHDALTGLHNAAGLTRWHDEHSGRSDRWSVIGAQPLRLDALDSSYGRDARNTLLTIISRRLRRTIGEHQVIARIGDPEFVILAPRVQLTDQIERIVQAFAHPLAVGSELVSVDLAIGVADVEADLEQAIANAATASRQNTGRSTSVVHFEQKHREIAVRRNELLRWLESAIEERSLEVHFQPVVNAVTTVAEGYECLIRGNRNGAPVSPAEFIPLAEESNLILDIGEFTLREACAALPFLPGDAPYVAVNLSPVELSDTGLIRRIDAILTETGVDRARIVFEVTEGSATNDTDIELLHRIRELGVKIAIDDFGTGHSSLSYLTTLPAQIVKLDRSLVTPIVNDRLSRTVVEGAIRMAHDIGMSVIAEGVETNEELNALRRFRCDRIQGWLTGRPAPLRDLVEVAQPHPRTTITIPADPTEQARVEHR